MQVLKQRVNESSQGTQNANFQHLCTLFFFGGGAQNVVAARAPPPQVVQFEGPAPASKGARPWAGGANRPLRSLYPRALRREHPALLSYQGSCASHPKVRGLGPCTRQLICKSRALAPLCNCPSLLSFLLSSPPPSVNLHTHSTNML